VCVVRVCDACGPPRLPLCPSLLLYSQNTLDKIQQTTGKHDISKAFDSRSILANTRHKAQDKGPQQQGRKSKKKRERLKGQQNT
jgi:hypothetical protein